MAWCIYMYIYVYICVKCIISYWQGDHLCNLRGKVTEHAMGLLPDTQNCGCACAGNAGNVFPVTAGKRSRHASRHVRHARAVMHAGIANLRYPLKSAAGENVPGIPGACATCNFTYLVRGPLERGFLWTFQVPQIRRGGGLHSLGASCCL